MRVKILIAGGGIAGLTLAAFLRDSGIDYEIVEKSPEERPGFLFITWDNFRDILKKLGLGDAYDTHAHRIDAYMIKDDKGRVLRHYNLKDFKINYGTGAMLVKRSDLIEWLSSKVDISKITRGISLTQLTETKNGVEATFSDGSKKKYDAAVGADGIHSLVRNQCFLKEAQTFDDWRCWWIWIDNKHTKPHTVTEQVGAGEVVIMFDFGDKSLMVLHAPVDHRVWDDVEGRADRLKKIFGDNPEPISQIVSALKDADAMPTDIIQLKMSTWTKGRIGLIGDAAHSFGPFAGLGGSMAMEDAYVLACELQKVSESYTIENAFATYERKRKPRLSVAKKLSAKMRMWMMVRSPLMRRIINMFVPYVPERFMVSDYNKLLRYDL